ncbi:ribonuclease E/G [Croceicoccus sp. F390]|uniref:Ribonuclease E n=2 Tax=Croceicoccus esteveae TaxID=3075597 RepID=A0ABU2ZGI9_9SPHN|nr:ribonuclease E/G [Croceicoccus sp. F390]MDT0575520.1 ribonuclease E/G [Croceicoccus sp. F390]
MLIDARHQEETRVAVLNGNRIEEFDFESSDHKQIKGNIYLAKVTRVEPSLQAAFVDFGGNRHGFLAFSEIHPDYYQIPKQDRDALLAEEREHAEEEARLRAAEDDNDSDDEDDLDDNDEDGDSGDDADAEDSDDDDCQDDGSDAFANEIADDEGLTEIDTSEKDDVSTIEDGSVSDDTQDGEDDGSDRSGRGRGRRQGRNRSRSQGRGSGRAKPRAADEARAKRLALRRRYKIQDVIQRRQVLLVQVVKEERGNKGAALTTYLSLAGRYCVLMPNSNHGGGISRKISSAADRSRLKQIVAEMDLPRSMGCIVRTAGLSRTKTEIKRDFDYLARLWDEIRERTMESSAPALIHSDSDLVKRAIRDIYNRDIEEVVVEGTQGYTAAREFMKLLMPSHVRRVKQYADPVPLFQRYGAEDQLTAMYEPVVQLKSGGYLVINPTEALVSIDINSGRSTKEHGIEQTALATNLEAAKEIARQLRLRDMAGLVVIDFIDMENNSSIRKVEKCLKDSLKADRARIQVGRISSFGLLEMSRQRLRTGVLEASTRDCPHCDGIGLVRTASSAGLSALRLIEDEAAKGKGSMISLHASMEAAVYLLNAKRADLVEIEQRYGVVVEVNPEGENEGAKMRVASSGPRPEPVARPAPAIVTELLDEDPVEHIADDEDEYTDNVREEASANDDDGGGDDDGDVDQPKRRRRRRGGRRNRSRNGDDQRSAADGKAPGQDGAPEADPDDADKADDARSNDDTSPAVHDNAQDEPTTTAEQNLPQDGQGADTGAETAPKKRRRSRRKPAGDEPEQVNVEPAGMDDAAGEKQDSVAEEASTEPAQSGQDDDAAPKPRRRTRRKPAAAVKEGEQESETGAAPEKPRARRPRRKKGEGVQEAADQTANAERVPEAQPSAADAGTAASAPDASPQLATAEPTRRDLPA